MGARKKGALPLWFPSSPSEEDKIERKMIWMKNKNRGYCEDEYDVCFVYITDVIVNVVEMFIDEMAKNAKKIV